jgi:hypothetical protein
MNQEQVMQKLLQLDDTVEDFIVTLSGKASSKVDGLYKPETREIIIHNKNHTGDNALMYTAIHEFAHHIQFTTSAAPVSARSHTNHFYSILHKLLGKARSWEYTRMYSRLKGNSLSLLKRSKRIFFI